MTAVDVGTKPEEKSLEIRRREYSQELLAQPGHDLADLTDVEFESGLRRLKTVQARMQRILKEALVEDVHFGREADRNGNPVFKKNRLKKAGAEELRRLMRLTVREIRPPTVVMTEDLVSVTVTCGIFDAMGRCLAEGQGACNTKEKRFRKFGDKKAFIYDDPREEYHNCLAMAQKRAAGLLTSEASGATGFFADGDELTDALDDDKPMLPWTKDEEGRVVEACQKKGIGRVTFARLRDDTLGRINIGSGEDVVKLLAAIEAYTVPARKPAMNEEPGEETTNA